MIFTEHLDFGTAWRTTTEDLMPHQRRLLDPDGYLRPTRFDVAGYQYKVRFRDCRRTDAASAVQ